MYLTQGLHRSRQQTPDLPATIFGDRRRTFAEHADRIARVAGGLRALGVSDGERVAILSLNSDRYCELLHAIPWAGGVLNPVNTRWSASEITYSLVDSATATLVVDDTFAPIVPEIRDGHRGLRTVIHAGDGPTPDGMPSYEELAVRASPTPDARRGGDAIAGVFYTGGTTGFPKGVVLTHANLVTGAAGGLATWPVARRAGRTLHVAPMFHRFALEGWLAQSMVGGTHVLVPRFDPALVLAAIDQHRVTSLWLVPTMVQMLVDHRDLDAYDRTTVRNVVYGASPVTEALLQRAMTAFPNADFVQGYGMTELAPITVLTPDDHRQGDRLRSAGRATVGVDVRIVDGSGGELPRGTVGEVAARGGQLMAGYWNKPEETAAALRGGWMHTGDGGYMDDDGYVFIVDRIKDMIISGGENVYSVEVEDVVGRHPAVATCAVIGVPDPQWGERVHAARRPQARCSRQRRRATRAHPAAHRRLQDAADDRVRRLLAHVRRGQGSQARTAFALRGRPGARRS